MIGVNAQIASESGGNDGVGFAIGADTAKQVAGALAAGEAVDHAYLGVTLQDGEQGPRVVAVADGSPAAEAGVEVGDEIVALEGDAVGSSADLRAEISVRDVDSQVTLVVLRGGERRTLEVTLGSRPA